jgi:hypothetical protein
MAGPTPGAPPPQPPAQEPPASARADSPSGDTAELLERLRQLEEQLAERDQQKPAGVGFGPAQAASEPDVPKPPEQLPDYAGEWPAKGGLDGPQPWDLHNLGLKVGTADDGSVTVTSPHTGGIVQLQPGAPDTVSPIVPAHGRPPLGPGSASPAVRELGELLAVLGYETSVSRGQNPQGNFDESIAAAVDRFRTDYGVEEDPSQFPRDGRANAQSHVLAWTWEAILRAAGREREAAESDRRQLAHAR